VGFKRRSGRSTVTGRITTRHKSTGVKKGHIFLTTSNRPFYGLVLGIAHDPIRSSFISINFNFLTKKVFASIACHKIFVGALIFCNKRAIEFSAGSRLSLLTMPQSVPVFALYAHCMSNASTVTSAGARGYIIKRNKARAKILLPSQAIKRLSTHYYATIGVVSNVYHQNEILGSAGSKRKKGYRPTVRGIAMNSVDHPHGGNGNGGYVSVSPWGKLAKIGKHYLAKHKKEK